jgi:alkylated DNA repair protein alkB family protein 5
MAKRKRADEHTDGETFSLLDGNVDILEGLVMHRNAIDEQFEQDLITFVQQQVDRGRRGELKKPTYLRASGDRSQGNKREAIMYGGFFDFNRARPGKRGLVPPFPPILERLVDHMMTHNYLPENVRPDSCIINQYDTGDCIPPHVDHSSYYRPISTLSLLGKEPMLVGTRFRTIKSCTWVPTCGTAVDLPRRSLLVLGGNSGNIAKHCISACTGKRISITLRKQPPLDWKPDESELVGKGTRRMNEKEEDVPRSKKALTGSAKRRKKMAKLMARGGGGGSGGSDFRGGAKKEGSSQPSSSSSDRMFAVQNNVSKKERAELKEKKKKEKQARRNARRLEKKNNLQGGTGVPQNSAVGKSVE